MIARVQSYIFRCRGNSFPFLDLRVESSLLAPNVEVLHRIYNLVMSCRRFQDDVKQICQNGKEARAGHTGRAAPAKVIVFFLTECNFMHVIKCELPIFLVG